MLSFLLNYQLLPPSPLFLHYQGCLSHVPEDIPLQDRGVFSVIDHGESDAEVPVEQVVDLKVVVVLPERVVEGFSHTQPAKVEEKLDRHEDWVVNVKLQKKISCAKVKSQKKEQTV